MGRQDIKYGNLKEKKMYDTHIKKVTSGDDKGY